MWYPDQDLSYLRIAEWIHLRWSWQNKRIAGEQLEKRELAYFRQEKRHQGPEKIGRENALQQSQERPKRGWPDSTKRYLETHKRKTPEQMCHHEGGFRKGKCYFERDRIVEFPQVFPLSHNFTSLIKRSYFLSCKFLRLYIQIKCPSFTLNP